MLNILQEHELMSKLEAMRIRFDSLSKDGQCLGRFFPVIDEVEHWKFSTGPVFDQPLYSAEMAGFDSGKILKKQYSNPLEARVKGSYSSGFIDDRHAVTVFPSKPADMPMEASFYHHEPNVIKRYSLTIYDASFCKIVKSPVLRGISETFSWREGVTAYVAVGARGAYSINLYYAGSDGVVNRVSMVTAPLQCQDDFEFIHDDTGLLKVLSNGVIWERKNKKAEKTFL